MGSITRINRCERFIAEFNETALKQSNLEVFSAVSEFSLGTNNDGDSVYMYCRLRRSGHTSLLREDELYFHAEEEEDETVNRVCDMFGMREEEARRRLQRAKLIEGEGGGVEPDLWGNDLIQFARLLCEISATQELDDSLEESMDLQRSKVTELFERAQKVWEKSKKDHCPAPTLDVPPPSPEEFQECAECAAKPGTPALCPACYHNRTLVARLKEQLQKVKEQYQIRKNMDFSVLYGTHPSLKGVGRITYQNGRGVDITDQLRGAPEWPFPEWPAPRGWSRSMPEERKRLLIQELRAVPEEEHNRMKKARNELEDQKRDHERILDNIRAVLWPDGDEEHEWDSDTFCELAEVLSNDGIGPTHSEGR